MCETETDGKSTSVADSPDEVSQLYQNPTDTQEAILSVFDLKEAEVRAYVAVIEHPDSTVKRIADVLDRHRHHVSRSLRGLLDTGLIDREKKNFETGGTGYVYTPIPAEEAKRYFQQQLVSWIDDVHGEIERLDERIITETDPKNNVESDSCGLALCERPDQ